MEVKTNKPQEEGSQTVADPQNFTPVEKTEVKEPSKQDPIFSKLNKNRKTIIIVLLAVGLLAILGTGSYFLLRKNQDRLKAKEEQPAEKITDQEAIPTAQAPQEKAENQPTSPAPTPLLIEFGLYGEDFSDGIGIEYATSVEISLYNEAGVLVDKKTSPATVEPMRNNIGKMPSAIFFVPPGKYTFEGETADLVGKGEKTVPADQGPQYWAIRMYIRPSTVTGKLFVDNNQNAVYDSGDEALGNQPIEAYYFTSQGKAMEANSTTTNASGDYSLILDKYAGTYQLQTDPNLPYMYPKWPRIEVGGSQQLSQNLYLLPR